MHVRDEAKTLRRKTIRQAVVALRQKLEVSQARFADMVGDDVDAGTVSRWERGVLTPQPRKREKLAAIALKHGLTWLGAAFRDPQGQWKHLLGHSLPEVYRRMVSLEICALNEGAFMERDNEDGQAEQFDLLMKIADGLLGCLVQRYNAGEEIIVVDDHHRKVWADIVKERQNDGKL